MCALRYDTMYGNRIAVPDRIAPLYAFCSRVLAGFHGGISGASDMNAGGN